MTSSKYRNSVDYGILGLLYLIAMISFGLALFGDGDSSHHTLATATFTGLALVYGRITRLEKRLNLTEASGEKSSES